MQTYHSCDFDLELRFRTTTIGGSDAILETCDWQNASDFDHLRFGSTKGMPAKSTGQIP